MNTILNSFVLLMFMAECSIVSASDLAAEDATNRIFVRSFSRNLACGDTMRGILGILPKDMVLTPEGARDLSREIRGIPVAEKCRLILLYLIVFDFDGEKAEMLVEDLGNDKVVVGETLARIPDESFKEACRNLGVSEQRVRMFRNLVIKWSSKK
ncbi:MAG: hypothetical protein ABI600_10990 [Luteolibacter sp.]